MIWPQPRDGDAIPVIGGPADGTTHPLNTRGMLCLTKLMPVVHHWYTLRTFAFVDANGERHYRDEWHYLGVGDLRGPTARKEVEE